MFCETRKLTNYERNYWTTDLKLFLMIENEKIEKNAIKIKDGIRICGHKKYQNRTYLIVQSQVNVISCHLIQSK